MKTKKKAEYRDLHVYGLMPAGAYKNARLKPYLAQLCDPSFKVHVFWAGEFRTLKPGVERKYFGNDNTDYDHFNHFHLYGKTELTDEWINNFVDAVRQSGGVVTQCYYQQGDDLRERIVVVDSIEEEAVKVAKYCGFDDEQCERIHKSWDSFKALVLEVRKHRGSDTYFPDYFDNWLKGQGRDF
jgi:hypothetical protein